MLYTDKIKEIEQKLGIDAKKLPNNLLTTHLCAICDCLNSSSGSQLSYPSNFYYMEDEEADIILNLSDFSLYENTGNTATYIINLSSEQINGKKIKFYYDETNLSKEWFREGELGENYIKFEIFVDKPLTLPTHIYMCYNGGVNEKTLVSLSVIPEENYVTSSPFVYSYNEIESEYRLDLLMYDVNSSECGTSVGYNKQCFFCLGMPINIAYVCDPNA